MEKKQSYMITGIIIILLITLIGFFKPYFGKFPSFDSVPLVTHLHLTAFLSWFAILIWQPNPGLGRMVALFTDRQTGLLAMIITPYIVILSIILYEKIKLKKHILKSPYALIFILFALELFLFINISGSQFWPVFIDKLADSY